MPNTSEIILSQNIHAGDSSVTTVIGDKFKGDGYYGRSDGLHTVQVDVSGFVGTIKIQGTLETDPSNTDWSTTELGTGNQSVDTTGLIGEENITSISYTDSDTSTRTYNFTGNYVWIRAYVEFTDGTINSIKLNH